MKCVRPIRCPLTGHRGRCDGDAGDAGFVQGVLDQPPCHPLPSGSARLPSPPLAAAAVGELIGSEFGSKRLGNQTLRRVLAVVLIVAGLKMVLT